MFLTPGACFGNDGSDRPRTSPVTTIGLEEVDLTAHWSSFRAAMLEVAAAVRRLRERAAQSAVGSLGASAVRAAADAAAAVAAGDVAVPGCAANALKGEEPTGHHFAIVAMTGTMTPALEEQTRRLFAIEKSAYLYRASRPVRFLQVWSMGGTKCKTAGSPGDCPGIVLDAASGVQEHLASENARTLADRDVARQDATAVFEAAASAVDAARLAANLELAALTDADADQRSQVQNRLKGFDADSAELRRGHDSALAKLADRTGGMVWMSTSKTWVNKVHKHNLGDYVEKGLVGATLTGSDESNSKTRTLLAQRRGKIDIVGVTSAGSVGLNWAAVQVQIFRAMPSVSMFVQTMHRVDRDRMGDGTVHHFCDRVHWQHQIRRLLAQVAMSKKRCVGCTGDTPFDRQRIAEVTMAERAVTAARETEDILEGGGCIVQGLSRALNPGTAVPTCRGVSTAPCTWCSSCLIREAGWVGSPAIPAGSSGAEEVAMYLDRVSNRGKAAVDYKLFERYIGEATTFTDARDRDRRDTSTLKIVAMPASAVAAALAKVYLTEEVEMSKAAPAARGPIPRDGKREPAVHPKSTGARTDPHAPYALVYRFSRLQFFLPDERGGGFRAGDFVSPIVHPRFKLEHMVSILKNVEGMATRGEPMNEEDDDPTGEGAPPQPAAPPVDPTRELVVDADAIADAVRAIDEARSRDDGTEVALKTDTLLAMCRGLTDSQAGRTGIPTEIIGTVRRADTSTDDLDGSTAPKRSRGGTGRGRSRGRGTGRSGKGKGRKKK